MSLQLQAPIPSVPADTARVAHAAFRTGTPYLILRDQLGTVFRDSDFADLFPTHGQPAYPPWRLALVTLMQFREGLSDRQAAEAVRARIDWKYLLGLELADPGFDHSLLCEFRNRLRHEGAEGRLLSRLLDLARTRGVLKPRGRQRTDSTYVLAAIRVLNRLELVGETLRAALEAVAVIAPDWVRRIAPPVWAERYGRRIEDARLPEATAKREAYAVQVGTDGFVLLEALDEPDTPEEIRTLPAITTLRRVWARHFERKGKGGPEGIVGLRTLRGRGSGEDRVESPYDDQARFRAKSGMRWTGYMVHFTESCEENEPHLVLHADTTPADVHEARRTEAIHTALAAKDLVPAEHLVDAAYVSAAHLTHAREQHGIDLIGPGRRNTSWQGGSTDGFTPADFVIDWSARQARCPEGHASRYWALYKDAAGQPYVRVRFDPTDCTNCLSRSRCTRSRGRSGRQLSLHTREEHEALRAARIRQNTAEGRSLYALRQGIEGTLSQAIRSFGLRRTRYRGLAKTHLQHVATAAALNLDRIAAWLQERPRAKTRTSRLTALLA